MIRRLEIWVAVLCIVMFVRTEARASETGQTEGGEESSFTVELEEELIDSLELEGVQNMIDDMLGKNDFSFKEALKKLMTGKEVLSKEAAWELLRGLFFSGYEREKGTFFRILLLVLLAAVFSNFADIFENGQIGTVSFYAVYLLLFMMLMENFSVLGSSLSENLFRLSKFMEVLAPAYFMTVAAAGGACTAAVFYEGVLLLVWMIQWVLLTILLPGTNLYILLKLVNHLSREEMLSKMAELLETAINWGLKTLIGFALGLQVVKNLIAPVMDSLKRSALGKTAGAIPGIGNAVNTVTELILTSAVLVRNSFGVAVLIVLILIGIHPLVHLGMLSLSYRFLAALAQPVSDKRIVGALSTFGEGCAILLRILITAEALCMLTFLVLMAGTG
ncbi:MAG: stage III sporulation protein AE [Eubacteriales bacterium]|nr:stage III sporulation protein AE [Eubacteriales bacterium]